jgi:MATE family multidrug resistance protein
MGTAVETTHPFRTEVGETLRLAGPVVASQLGQISMGFIDTVMVGRLGSEALAGVALGNTVFFTLLVVCMGVVIAVGPMVSQAYGAGEVEPIGRSVRQGLWMGFVLAVPAILVLWNVAPLLRLMGQAEVAVQMAEAYLQAIAWGFLPALWFVALRSFVEGLSRPLPVTIIILIGVVVNVAGNYVLMFGKLGLPALGLAGTGWASTIVFWAMLVLLAAYVQGRASLRSYRVFARLGRPDGQYFRELLRIGWPIGVQHGLESGLFMTTAFLMGLLGTSALAAHQVALQCAAFTFMVPLGLGIAGSVRVGQAAGRQDPDGVRRSGFVAMVLAASFMLGAAVLFWAAPEAIVGLYLDLDDPANAQVVRLAASLLGIAAVFQVFDGVQVSAAGALRGLKDTRSPMLIGFLSYWVIGLTTAYVLGFEVGWGAMGLWWGLVLGLASAAVLLAGRFARLARRVDRLQPVA